MLRSKQYQFHVLVPLWNPAYVDQARKFLFSSLLAPGNLNYGDIPIDMHVVGKKSEESLIVNCPEWQPINRLCNAQFDGLDDSIFDEMSYIAMSNCYDYALSRYESPESVFVFLTGDIVLAQNTFSFLRSLLDEGYRAAMVPGPRVREESIEYLRRADGVLIAEGRDLMRAMWEKPLALTAGYQVMDNGRNKCPNHYYWRVGEYSTLARNMMMHPLMVWPDHTSARVVCPGIGANAASAALDQGYMRYAVARPETIYVGYDSDKLAVVSISSDDHFSNDIMIEEGYTPEQEKSIFSAFCNDYHFWYGAHDLFLRGEDLEAGAWTAAQEKAAATINAKMDFMWGVMADSTANTAESLRAAQTPQRRLVRRAASLIVWLRNRIATTPYVLLLYRKGVRFLLPSLGRLETSVQNLSLQFDILGAGQNKLKSLVNDSRTQLNEAIQGLAQLDQVAKDHFGRIIALEAGIQTVVRKLSKLAPLEEQKLAPIDEAAGAMLEGVAERIAALETAVRLLDTKVSEMPSPSALRLTQQFVTEVFPSYRWLEHCDPASITGQPPLGYYSSVRARCVYKDAFYIAVDYLISNQLLGPILEFGSRSGFTSRCLGETMAERNYPGKLYLYDSFEGLPEITSEVDLFNPEVSEQKVWFKGAMAMPDDTVERIGRDMQIFMQPSQFEIIKGFFSDTLPKALPEEPVALVHIDCDLYQSTMEVLEALQENKLLQDGAILMFDDYNTSRANPKRGERRALRDFLHHTRSLSVSPFFAYNWHGQAFFLHIDELAE